METAGMGWGGVRSGGGARLVIHVWKRARKSGKLGLQVANATWTKKNGYNEKDEGGRQGRGGEKINGRDIVHIVRWWVGG